jgi:hypothetical protein
VKLWYGNAVMSYMFGLRRDCRWEANDPILPPVILIEVPCMILLQTRWNTPACFCFFNASGLSSFLTSKYYWYVRACTTTKKLSAPRDLQKKLKNKNWTIAHPMRFQMLAWKGCVIFKSINKVQRYISSAEQSLTVLSQIECTISLQLPFTVSSRSKSNDHLFSPGRKL